MKLSEFYTFVIKKYFPNPQSGLVRVVATVSTTYTAATPGVNHQTDSTGVKELTFCIPGSEAAGVTGMFVAFGAPSNETAKLWLDDATTDTDTLQRRYIPRGQRVTFHFSPAITVWDMKAIGANIAALEQEKAQ